MNCPQKTDSCEVIFGAQDEYNIFFYKFIMAIHASPGIAERPTCLECRVVQELNIQRRYLFLGKLLVCTANVKFVGEQVVRKALTDLTRHALILDVLNTATAQLGYGLASVSRKGKS